MKHLTQPLCVRYGNVSFKSNRIVYDLLDAATSGERMDMNTIFLGDYTQEDREQFAQLIGYSVSGYHELSYVSDESALKASEEARKIEPDFKACRDCNCDVHSGVPVEELENE